jgi:hypothetical protein
MKQAKKEWGSIRVGMFALALLLVVGLWPRNPHTPIGRGVITEIGEYTAPPSFLKEAPRIGVAVNGDTLRVEPGTTVWGPVGARIGDSVFVSISENGVYYTKKMK